MAKVTINQVYKTYKGEQENDDITAVEDVTFEVGDRQIVVLVGPSGCGKSTTLRMIAGLEEISGGDILIGDRCVNDVPPKDRDIAMVFQNYALLPHMSVYDNLAFGLRSLKISKAQIKTRVMDAAALLGIEHLLDRRPKALSGGQRQRVAIGRAIVRQPKVFLFDEPLSNLDTRLRMQLRMEIKNIHRRLQTTMIYVTHDQAEAMAIGDRIVVMNEGAVQQIDTPLNLYNAPTNLFVAGFFGSPPMNLIEGTLSANKNGLKFHEKGDGTITLLFPDRSELDAFVGKEVTLGIRPAIIEPVAEENTSKEDIFPAVVDLVEPLGSETNFYCHTGEHTITARSHASTDNNSAGRRMRFKIDKSKVHVFDPETTKRIE